MRDPDRMLSAILRSRLKSTFNPYHSILRGVDPRNDSGPDSTQVLERAESRTTEPRICRNFCVSMD